MIMEYSVTLSSFVGESADPSLPPPRQENRLESGAMQSARWGLMNLDAQARIAARTQGCAAVIRTNDDGSRLAANLAFAHEGAWSASLALPHGTAIRFIGGQETGGPSLGGLYIDRAGRSLDATIEIAGEGAPAERWLLHGLTGQFTRIDSGGGV